jgi:hypothetical protein
VWCNAIFHCGRFAGAGGENIFKDTLQMATLGMTLKTFFSPLFILCRVHVMKVKLDSTYIAHFL